jgi:hypothetical protein
MTTNVNSYSRVAKVPAIDVTIRQTSRSGINLVKATGNLINLIGVDALSIDYNTARLNDGMDMVDTDTVGRYGRGELRKLPEHFSSFIVERALKFAS